MAATIAATGIPGVGLGASKVSHGLPFVGVDSRQMGRLVAEHFFSSGLIAVDDPAVAAGIRYVRAHACHGIGVGDVVKHAGLPHALASSIRNPWRRPSRSTSA